MNRTGLVSTSFVGGLQGTWRVSPGDGFVLPGITGHARYVERAEKAPLDARSPSLARAEATCAALIPIRVESKTHIGDSILSAFCRAWRAGSITLASCSSRSTFSPGSSSQPSMLLTLTNCSPCCVPEKNGPSVQRASEVDHFDRLGADREVHLGTVAFGIAGDLKRHLA